MAEPMDLSKDAVTLISERMLSDSFVEQTAQRLFALNARAQGRSEALIPGAWDLQREHQAGWRQFARDTLEDIASRL